MQKTFVIKEKTQIVIKVEQKTKLSIMFAWVAANDANDVQDKRENS